MTPRRRCAAFIALALVTASPVVAQTVEAYAFIIYAEGYDLTIYRNGRLESYDVLVDDVIGMPLLVGDLVQTDADTFVEIQVMPSRTVIKVAENTTFEIRALGGAGGGQFEMTYGRVRARVERITGSERFEIRGNTTVAGVRGTDFGYDVVVEREALGDVEERVYVFDGEVGVRSAAADDAAGDEVLLRPDQMVRVVTTAEPEPQPGPGADGSAAEPARPERPLASEPIDQAITDYWQEAAFREEPLDPERVEEVFPEIRERVRRLTEEQQAYLEFERLRREGILGVTATEARPAASADQEQPAREPRRLALQDPPPGAARERLIVESTGEPAGRRLRRAGGWFTATGLVAAGAGIAAFQVIDGSIPTSFEAADGPALGAVVAGATLVTSGIISFLLGQLLD